MGAPVFSDSTGDNDGIRVPQTGALWPKYSLVFPGFADKSDPTEGMASRFIEMNLLNEIIIGYNLLLRNLVLEFPLPLPNQETILGLLLRNIPRGLIMGLEEAKLVGAQRAFAAARGMDDGHLPSVVGQLRHFHMNESFHRALTVADASPSPLCGNQIVTGRAGIFTLARFNTKFGAWNSGRRSETRKQMSLANAAIEPLVQPELFSSYMEPSQAVAFIVACFAGSLRSQPDTPVSIEIAVPDRHMRGWLFREPINAFVNRYDQQPTAGQNDLAVPKLKKTIGKPHEKDGTGS